MPESDLDEILAEAAAAVQYAQEVRAHHRKRSKRGNPQREADLKVALKRLRSAMDPIRTVLGRYQFEFPSLARVDKVNKIRKASLDLQRERRKLWKMRNRPTNKKETP